VPSAHAGVDVTKDRPDHRVGQGAFGITILARAEALDPGQLQTIAAREALTRREAGIPPQAQTAEAGPGAGTVRRAP
jgi:hypothetical protein